MILLVLKLLVAHALCDYPLQGDFLAKAKNPRAPIPEVPWAFPMAAHAAIHGGAVAFCTGSPLLGVLEAALHAVIDYEKCVGRFTFAQDQIAHVMCKVAWALMAPVLVEIGV